MLKFFKFLERWKYYYPSSFLICIFSVYLCFTTLFHHLPSFSTKAYQAQVNILDTRKTFLKKMENQDMREKFLETYNQVNSIE